MVIEALVLVGEQRLEEARIDVVARRWQPPAAFGREIGAQKLAVAVDHDGRDFEVTPKRSWPERLEQAGDSARDRRGNPHHPNRDIDRSTPPRVAALLRSDLQLGAHFAGETVISPVPVRPKRSGRYMSSTTACGST